MTGSRSGKGKPFNVSLLISRPEEEGDNQHRLSPLMFFDGSAWESNQVLWDTEGKTRSNEEKTILKRGNKLRNRVKKKAKRGNWGICFPKC